MVKKIKRTIKYKGGRGCLIEQTVSDGRRTFKCRGLKRVPTVSEILRELDR